GSVRGEGVRGLEGRLRLVIYDWSGDAACKGKSDMMFPTAKRDILKALAVCAECPVVEPCRAVSKNEPFGVWGGVSAGERGFPEHRLLRASVIKKKHVA